MGSSAPAAPAAPNPITTAAAQTGENVDTAVANNAMAHVNQTDQFGDTSTYSQNGTTNFTDPLTGQVYNIPMYSQSTTLGPAQSQLYETGLNLEQGEANTANSLLGNEMSNLSTPFNPGSLTMPQVSMPTQQTPTYSGPATGMPTAANMNNYINTAWEQPFNNLEGQQQEQLNQQLLDAGFAPGTSSSAKGGGANTDQGWNNAQYNFGQQEQGAQDTYDTAMYGTAMSGLEAEQQLGQSEQQIGQQEQSINNAASLAAQTANQGAAATQYGENLQAYNQAYTMPLNELNALASGSQIANATFQPTSTSQIPTTDYAQIAQNSFQDQLAADQYTAQNNSANLGGLFGLGGSIISGGLML